jgi:hypothetical protein
MWQGTERKNRRVVIVTKKVKIKKVRTRIERVDNVDEMKQNTKQY